MSGTTVARGRLRAGRASLTARWVGLARGLGAGRLPPDPTAPWLLGGRSGTLARVAAGTPLGALLRWGSLGLVDHVVLRTAAIDRRLRSLLERTDAGQLVVLGAGYDGRPWRLPCLRHVVVYEVDHPSTARAKRARAATRPTTAAGVRFVEVDFERDALAPALLRAGYEPQRPSLWLWEGVTMYLPPRAIAATLRRIGALASPGSHLLLSYAAPPLVAPWPRLDPLVRAALTALGEPLRGVMPPARMHGLLQEAGFTVREDSEEPQWGEEVGQPSRPLPIARTERLVHAERSAAMPPRVFTASGHRGTVGP